MTVRRTLTHTLVCDGDECAALYSSTEPTVMAARIHAAVDGWHFAEGRLPTPDAPMSRSHKGQRQFDYCPACWPTSYHATRRTTGGTL